VEGAGGQRKGCKHGMVDTRLGLRLQIFRHQFHSIFTVYSQYIHSILYNVFIKSTAYSIIFTIYYIHSIFAV
jgi:hypothetical protein